MGKPEKMLINPEKRETSLVHQYIEMNFRGWQNQKAYVLLSYKLIWINCLPLLFTALGHLHALWGYCPPFSCINISLNALQFKFIPLSWVKEESNQWRMLWSRAEGNNQLTQVSSSQVSLASHKYWKKTRDSPAFRESIGRDPVILERLKNKSGLLTKETV